MALNERSEKLLPPFGPGLAQQRANDGRGRALVTRAQRRYPPLAVDADQTFGCSGLGAHRAGCGRLPR